jgi:hypothetical protein
MIESLKPIHGCANLDHVNRFCEFMSKSVSMMSLATVTHKDNWVCVFKRHP